jgi:hypothetical protein
MRSIKAIQFNDVVRFPRSARSVVEPLLLAEVGDLYSTPKGVVVRPAVARMCPASDGTGMSGRWG